MKNVYNIGQLVALEKLEIFKCKYINSLGKTVHCLGWLVKIRRSVAVE